MTIDFANKAALIVRRTAQFGLTQSQESDDLYEKWLLVWACDVAGELGEVFEAETEREQILECGDVLWGLTALCLLLEIPPIEIFNFDRQISGGHDALATSLRLLDHCKKVTRDGMETRKIDKPKMVEWMRSIFTWLEVNYPVGDALDAVEAKLRDRYPDGFTPQKSVNR